MSTNYSNSVGSWTTMNTTSTSSPTISMNTTSTSSPTISIQSMGSGYGFTSGSYSISTASTVSNNTISVQGDLALNNDSRIKTPKHDINFNDLIDNINMLNELLCIIMPNHHLMEKYPTLQDAFDSYRVAYNNAKTTDFVYTSKEIKQAYDNYRMLEVMIKESKNDQS